MILDPSVICFALLLGGVPQGPPPPPPPPPPSMPAPRDSGAIGKGTAVIKGHVFSAEGRPLRRAQISASTGSNPPPRDAPRTTTGLEGEFELRDLPAGRFTLHATRSGYLPAQHGQREYGEPGTPVEVAAGATVDKIDLVMSRAGVLSGRILDDAGDAAAGVDVRVMQLQHFRGRKRLVPVASGLFVHGTTDDNGHYRLAALPPGEYYVAARLRDTWMSDEKEPQMVSYAPTYFPGTGDVADARRVKVASGQEVGGIDFALVPVRAAMLSGTVVGSDGAPLSGGRIMLTWELMGPSGGSMGSSGTAVIERDGTWKIRDVPPGEYTVRATGGGGDRPAESASLPVTVYGADLTGLVVTADPGGFLSGRVVTDTGEPLPESASRPSITTTPLSMDTNTMRPTAGTNDGVVGQDGRFTRKSASGPVVIRAVLPRDWGVKSIVIGDREMAGLPIDVRPGQTVADITVTVSKRLPTLSGRVTQPDEKIAAATVVLFPEDPARWIEAAANQRIARADRSGAYRFQSILPGDYLVVALDRLESWQINDPEMLSALAKRAEKVSLRDPAVTVDLKVVR